jgi:hypothetical protein
MKKKIVQYTFYTFYSQRSHKMSRYVPKRWTIFADDACSTFVISLSNKMCRDIPQIRFQFSLTEVSQIPVSNKCHKTNTNTPSHTTIPHVVHLTIELKLLMYPMLTINKFRGSSSPFNSSCQHMLFNILITLHGPAEPMSTKWGVI